MPKEQKFLNEIKIHKGILFKISKMYVNNFEDQKDLYQEIIYQAWKSYDSFQGHSKFSTWLYQIALNTAIVFFKKTKKSSFIHPQDLENLIMPIPEDDDTESQLKNLYMAINQLSSIDKAIIFYYLEGFTGNEIGIQLGISDINARVKLSRAKDKLKELIKIQTD